MEQLPPTGNFSYKNENINTMNQIKKLNDGKIIKPKLTENQINLNSVHPLMYMLSIKKDKNAETEVPKEFEKLIKDIIENNNESYLSGEVNLIEQIISKRLLIPVEKFKETNSINLKIDENFGLLSEVGLYLPNLTELNLKASNITSLSELGSDFSKLKSLNVSYCNLKDLTGMNSFNK
jgi:hypothetical protein